MRQMSKKVLVTLPDELLDYVIQRQDENNIKSLSGTICDIIRKEKSNDGHTQVADAVVEKIEEKYKNLFTRIRLGTTAADKNVQVLIECFNALAFDKKLKPMPTTVMESEVVSDSRKVVKERIENFKQKKDWNAGKAKK